MLNGSILGTLYRFWLGSTVFALLRRLWHACSGVIAGSRFRRLLLGPTRLDAWYSRSLAARLVRKVLDLITAFFRALCGAAAHSKICAFLAPAFRGSKALKFEFLLGAFCCVMFIVPHDYWNNLYAVAAAGAFLGLTSLTGMF